MLTGHHQASNRISLGNCDPNVSIIVNKYKIWHWIKYDTLSIKNSSRYLKPRTVIVIVKFWIMGANVFTFGVVLPLGEFRVARWVSN